jgi:hypothetical protein
MVGSLVNDELGRMWKEVVRADCEDYPGICLEGSETLCLMKPVQWTISKIKDAFNRILFPEIKCLILQ